MSREVLGEKHPDVALILWNFGILRCKQKQFEAARSVLMEALPIYKATLGDKHPQTKKLATWLTAVQVRIFVQKCRQFGR